jgi:membrane peptidoglycan carboxypeptidase
VDYFSLPRILVKSRVGADASLLPQGGSTITQQLVRGLFLQEQTAGENGAALQSRAILARALSVVVGARQVNRFLRKHEEMRLSLWLEREMRATFGSKQAAKEAIFARYASFVYMGHGQYGFGRAAAHYLGRPLSSLTADDADLAALLAGIMKAPRDYAPSAANATAVLRRRNQTLALMAGEQVITRDQLAAIRLRELPAPAPEVLPPINSAAVVQHVLDAFTQAHPDLSLEDLLQGRIQVYSTIDSRVQRIASEALEHGLERYEQRHPRTRGSVQGSVVVLRNSDGSILAEIGGRQTYLGKAATFRDFNRVTQSRRQPGSAMKPIVYLAAFRQGDFTLETLVPDEPISVPDGGPGVRKWISNYDGVFKGLMPVRQAFAESRNTVAIWMTSIVGIDRVLQTARSLGVETPLKRFPTTALGASEISLLELATAYRAIASGVSVPPYVIRKVSGRSGEPMGGREPSPAAVAIEDAALLQVQEGLRSVVRLPTGTAHALAGSRRFPLDVMGKTGTTNEFRDAIFVGSTYGATGITVAVRIGFDDNRSLGSKETGGRVALPVFEEVMREVYGARLVGPAPAFPRPMEQRITSYLEGAAKLPHLMLIGR